MSTQVYNLANEYERLVAGLTRLLARVRARGDA
jgi:hypothetical protein